MYEKYKGRESNDGDLTGIIVGYSDSTDPTDDAVLIMAITKDILGMGWVDISQEDHIFDMFNNTSGYWYTDESHIIFKFGH